MPGRRAWVCAERVRGPTHLTAAAAGEIVRTNMFTNMFGSTRG